MKNIQKAVMINRAMAEVSKAKPLLIKLNIAIGKFKDKIKNLTWEELDILDHETRPDSDCLIIQPPRKILSEYEKLKQKIENLDKFSGLGYEMLWGSDEKMDELSLSITIEKNGNNRVHINQNGLPYGFRQLGLGIKIYKKLIQKFGFISTAYSQAYDNSKLVWFSLISDKEIYTFMHTGIILAFHKSQDKDVILQIISEAFKTLRPDEYHLDEEFTKHNIEDIKNSELRDYNI